MSTLFWAGSLIIYSAVFVYVVWGPEIERAYKRFWLRREMTERCPTCNIKTFQAKNCVSCDQKAGLR